MQNLYIVNLGLKKLGLSRDRIHHLENWDLEIKKTSFKKSRRKILKSSLELQKSRD